MSEITPYSKAEEPTADTSTGLSPEMLADVEDIEAWLSPENLANKAIARVEEYEVTRSIDGRKIPGREVSLVKLKLPGAYDPHIHKESDAYFIITQGEGTFITAENGQQVTRAVKPGDKIDIPRGMIHGFQINEGGSLEWVSIQYPPIYNAETGKEDLYIVPLSQLS